MNHSSRKPDTSGRLGVDAPFAVVNSVVHPVVHPVPHHAPDASRARPPAAALRVTSAQIFSGALEVHIDHHGTMYRLKQTALGKLILTK